MEALQWVRETQPRYRELLKLEGKAVKAIETGNEILGRLRERRLLAVQELRDKEQAAEGCAWRLAKARGEVTELRRLADGAETWRADVVWVGEARAREDKLSTALEGLRGEEGTLASRLARSRTSEARLDKQIAAVERERSDFSALLGRVEGYIRDARCPLCGHDHGSAEALRKQVGEQRSQDAAAELRERVIALKEAGKELAHRLAELREDAALQSSQGEELRERRRTREARIATVEEAIEQIDIAAKEPNLVIVEIGERWAHARGNAERLEGRGAVLRREVKSHSAMTGDLDREIEHEERAVVEMERELAEYRRRLGQLRGDRRALEVSLDADAATLQEGVDRASDELSKADVAVAEESGVAKESTEAVNALRRRATTLATTLDGLKKEIGARGITLREVNAQLREFGFAAGVETAEVVRLLEAETKTNGRLAELRDFADSVEVAMDTATTTATLRQHRWAVRDRQRRIEETEREIERHESWRSYFAAVGEKLAEKQNAAVARFADEYGPTASAIQERLRSVYGFEGIDTRSHESTIRVRVKRGSEVLRPTDYFSDSQQRTLLLGLFLTASISQSWSHLTTVLLDDPVMHFDDVNTYAFLDMIAGFLNARSGPRQFIVSTCDRKVLQLARNRFRHLGRDARFYEFAAIGRDGPVVEEIPAG